MTNKEYILKITDKNSDKRLEKIESCLKVNHVRQFYQGITNLIVPAKNQADKITLMAHHDVFPNSLGYNDNSTGVVTLLKMQDYLTDNIELVFTDREECGGKGCDYYLKSFPKPKKAINVDVVGLGDKIFYEGYEGGEFFDVPDTLQVYDNVPFSDSYILAEHGVPNILLLTGRNKNVLISEIFEAQHCGKYDSNLDKISEETMDNVFNTLRVIVNGLISISK